MTEQTPPGRSRLPLTRSLQEMTGIYQEIVRGQLTRLSGTFERMSSGNYTADQWAGDVARLLTGWVGDALAVTNVLRGTVSADDIPTAVIILDAEAENSPTKVVPLTARLNPGVEIQRTGLRPITGDHPHVSEEQVVVEVSPGMDQLQIQITDVGNIDHGSSYIGWVYAATPGNNITLAVVHVLKP